MKLGMGSDQVGTHALAGGHRRGEGYHSLADLPWEVRVLPTCWARKMSALS